MSPNLVCFLHAIRQGDISTTKNLLDSYDLSHENDWSDGHRFLHEALENKQEKIARLLLVRDAKVNCAYKCWFKSPLHSAATHGYVDVVEMLLDRNADVYAKDHERKTPIHCAVEEGCYETVKSLLKKMISLEVKSGTGMTPLQLAAHLGRTQIVEALLDHGADVYSTCTSFGMQGNTPLHFAAAQGDKGTVALLLRRGANVNAVNEKRMTPLHVATEKNRYEAAKLFLKHGANIDTCDKYGRTILCIAVENGDLPMTQLILDHRPDSINSATENEETALHTAVSRGFTFIVELLLERGAMLNVVDEKNVTPLHLCAWKGYDKILKMLLDKGASVNATTENGETALHAASSREDPRKYSRSAMSRCRRSCEHDELELFSKFTTNDYYNVGIGTFSPPLITFPSTNYDNTLKILLDRGAAVNAKSVDGVTPLLLAVKGCHIETVKLLVQHGADVNVRNNIGEIPLHAAVIEDNIKIFDILLELSGNLNSTDVFGRTALHIAATRANDRVVRLLLDRDCDVNLTCTKYGQTPLDCAMLLHKSTITSIIHDCDSDNFCDDPLDSYKNSSEKVVVMLVYHIIKLVALNRYVCEKNLKLVTASVKFEDIHNKCMNEIEHMRKKYIGDSKVSFYDILTKSESTLAHYARNKSIVDTLESGDHKDEFRLYYRMIDYRFKNGQTRERLLDSSFKSMRSLIGDNLPDLSITKLLNYLSNRDLKNLIKAGPAISHE